MGSILITSNFAFSFSILNSSLDDHQNGFIENKGQIIDQHNKPNPEVLYLLNNIGLNVQLRKNGFSYDVYSVEYINNSNFLFSGNNIPFNPNNHSDSLVPSYSYQRIDLTLVGVNPNCIIIPSNPFPDYFNYFTAYTPATGIKNIRQFKNITYKNIYPGIDLEFVTNEEHGYKYNFIIWPEGKISSVKLKISDSSMVTLENDSLIFHTMFGNLFELIPESYREVNHNKVKVKCRFIKINDGIYGFSVDDTILKNSELIIDPTSIRLWGTYYGGNNSEWGAHGCTDNFSNVFIAGRTESDNNIATAGSYQSTRAGAGDGYLAKFNAAGQRQWGTYFGGSNYEYVNSCNSDRTGNVYIEGYTSSTSGI
ncbi:MAG: hypothetical protein WCJ61_12645, partial [Paludibacter sp.]